MSAPSARGRFRLLAQLQQEAPQSVHFVTAGLPHSIPSSLLYEMKRIRFGGMDSCDITGLDSCRNSGCPQPSSFRRVLACPRPAYSPGS